GIEAGEDLTPWPPLPSHTHPPGEGERRRGAVDRSRTIAVTGTAASLFARILGGSPLSRGMGVRWERGARGVRSSEQRRHHRPPADLLRREQPDHPVLSVVSGLPADLSGAQ